MSDIKLTHLGTYGKPPNRTDVGFSKKALISNNMFNPIYLGVACGIALTLVFILLALLQILGVSGIDLSCLESLIPCYSCTEPFANIWAFIFVFLYGFVFGTLIGGIYNSFILATVIDTDTYDAFA